MGSFLNQGDFVRVQKQRKSGSGRAMIVHPVTATLHNNKAGKGEYAMYVALRLLSDVLKECGWEPEQYVHLHEGTGQNAGKVLLIRSDASLADNERGAFKLSHNTPADQRERGIEGNVSIKVAVSSLEHHVAESDETIRAQACRYTILDGELLIEMPAWFRGKDARPTAIKRVIDEPIKRSPGRPRKNAQA